MTGEINKDFYCLTNHCDICEDYYLSEDGGSCNEYCPYRRRKWPTPEQFEEKYGRKYPDDGAVYFLEFFGGHSYAPDWVCRTLKEVNGIGGHYAGKIVCACTPFGKPPRQLVQNTRNDKEKIVWL